MNSRVAALRQKATAAAKAVNDTFHLTTVVFERHKVTFTIGASVASAAAAWAGYTARQVHQKKLEDRLKSIEHAMTNVHNMEEAQVDVLRAAVGGGIGYQSCAATVGTGFVIGYMGF
ncbi:hypothetical protein CBR_g23765 [Chara braunii]|uniref:Uncharacterized protein n=1 Tax=Chara braunii TaxID=69332 RepID=A0A388JVL5_CHABU|nr:hypothetical protein CBR_g23765 [Chara braunii]|eukprot:GBG61807.1 hypothetical protein CBR_g23765 [Chara braunii]